MGEHDVDLPWIEKYRPKELSEVVGNEEIIRRLIFFSENGNLPNIILTGSPGCGKTTSILCLAQMLLRDQFKDAVLELNASNERGIDVVRREIKMFAQKKLTLPHGRHKIVILDEADSMTEGAQQALRRIIEDYSSSTRFALACNSSDKIIEPIQSRCTVLRFSTLNDKQILQRLLYICDREKVVYTDDGIDAILFTSQGDMRYALNNLQTTHRTFDLVDCENVYKLCDEPHPFLIQTIIRLASQREVKHVLKEFKYVWDAGYSAVDIVSTMSRVAKTMPLPEHIKLEFLKLIGLAHIKVISGHTSYSQIVGLLCKMCINQRLKT